MSRSVNIGANTKGGHPRVCMAVYAGLKLQAAIMLVKGNLERECFVLLANSKLLIKGSPTGDPYFPYQPLTL